MKKTNSWVKGFLFFLFLFTGIFIQAQEVTPFIESGTTIHSGDNTPLWQVSNQHGLSSLKNSSYLRSGVFYHDSINHWRIEGGLDMAVAAGFTSTVVLQQAYADIRFHNWGIWAGSREINSPLLNQALSSGGLTWSGNARPLPQVCIGILDYVHLSRGIQVKGELSFGWWTDNNYQREHVGENFFYTKSIKYCHRNFFFRFGVPESRWSFDVGMSLDDQFGGYKVGGVDQGDLGNSFKDYLNALVPQSGGENSPEGAKIWYNGNFMGSEHLKLNYRFNHFSLSAYLENYYDDFSGMGKKNKLDGLWGLEMKTDEQLPINNIVLEYYQTTNQSGPLHGLDNSIVKKHGGADDYYNNDWYPGWVHWGMTMANPLIASPIYNKNGDLGFLYNRIKAVHLGWAGCISRDLSYRAKVSFNKTWGTPFKPTLDILENFSTFAEFKYLPHRLSGWSFAASLAFDTGDIYGDNFGFQMKIRKSF